MDASLTAACRPLLSGTSRRPLTAAPNAWSAHSPTSSKGRHVNEGRRGPWAAPARAARLTPPVRRLLSAGRSTSHCKTTPRRPEAAGSSSQLQRADRLGFPSPWAAAAQGAAGPRWLAGLLASLCLAPQSSPAAAATVVPPSPSGLPPAALTALAAREGDAAPPPGCTCAALCAAPSQPPPDVDRLERLFSPDFEAAAALSPVSTYGVQLSFDPPPWLPWGAPGDQVPPAQGTCPTCIGVVDDTLGSCGPEANCVSSFDDRPAHFVTPWEYPPPLADAARALGDAVARSGGSIVSQTDRYVYATFVTPRGVTDDVEFLFSDPASDATLNIRAASREAGRPDGGRNARRLEELRAALRWQQVPVLRNRRRLFFFVESPWDSFGPVPPASIDYKAGLDAAPFGGD